MRLRCGQWEWRSEAGCELSSSIAAHADGSLAPLLRGEGWGEGLFDPQMLKMR